MINAPSINGKVINLVFINHLRNVCLHLVNDGRLVDDVHLGGGGSQSQLRLDADVLADVNSNIPVIERLKTSRIYGNAIARVRHQRSGIEEASAGGAKFAVDAQLSVFDDNCCTLDS